MKKQPIFPHSLRRRARGIASSVCCVIALGWLPAHAQPIPVTTCGQVVSGDALLVGDLDCWPLQDGVVIEKGTLDMNGFTIRGSVRGIVCGSGGVTDQKGKCTILGPGAISATISQGILANNKLVLDGVTVFANDNVGIAPAGRFRIVNSHVWINSGKGISGIDPYNKLRGRIDNSIIEENGGHGVADFSNVRIKNSVIERNGGSGVRIDRIKATDSTITGNGLFGVHGGDYFSTGPDCCCIDRPRRIKLVRTQVTGNGTDGACGITEPCADIAACKEPALRDPLSTCDSSHVLGSGIVGQNWEVCTGE